MKKIETAHIVVPDKTTLNAIKDYIGDGKEGALFMNRTLPTRLNEGMCRTHIKKLAIDSGIHKNVTPHFFKRSNITHKKAMGVQDADMQKISGHKSLESLKHYNCTDFTHLKAITEKFTPKFDTTPTSPQKPFPPSKIAPEKEEIRKLIHLLPEKVEKQEMEKKHSDNRIYG